MIPTLLPFSKTVEPCSPSSKIGLPGSSAPRGDARLGSVAFARWAVILVPLAAVVGTLCAAFLLESRRRDESPVLASVAAVPAACRGFAIGLLYHRVGRSVEGGNNLIVDQIHEPGGGVPLRMAPLIFLGTVVTHLFGGSAGREGTAVQLGGSLASGIGRLRSSIRRPPASC